MFWQIDDLVRSGALIASSLQYLITAQNRFDNMDKVAGQLAELGEYDKVII
jgi:hypothetical protein